MAHRVVIISAHPADVQALEHALGQARDGPFECVPAASLAEGLAAVARLQPDAILIDLDLPDSQGLAGFYRLYAAARHTPILTLCALDNEDDATAAVQHGAQGFLSKGYFDSYLVPQALRNIIQRKAFEERLYLAQVRAEITLNSIGDGVISTDMHGRVDYLNIAAEQLSGWTREAARGRLISEVLQLVDADSGEAISNPVAHVLSHDTGIALRADTVLISRTGACAPIEDSAAPIHDRDGQIVGAVLVFRDISRTLALTRGMRHLAQHDYLTNLPNRLLLNDRIEQAIAMARRHDAHLAVLFLDLDKFKHINDSLGHAVGDKLLRSVSQRLLACVRTSDTVSRQGGDEFVILLAEDRRVEDAALTAEKILAALNRPHWIGGNELSASTSIGISVFPADGEDAGTLIKNADTAMYHAKERGRNNYQFFREEMNTRAVERQRIEADLRGAIARAELQVFYQPKVDLLTRRITGVEALLRWQHPQWGLLLPERFVAVAEDCGLILPIGRWVLEQACLQAVRWRADGLHPISVAVNVSALEFRNKDFYEHVCDTIRTTGVDPHCLQLELTESVLMRDVDASAAVLSKFKACGVQIAVDDFGTGYSSLSYLNQFPIDVLKIDQSFVHAINAGAERNGAIVSAVIGMGNNLHQRVIAEGVEDLAQLAFLRARQCPEGQGYLFSRPVDAAAMQGMLRTGVCA
ncbi:EAL domain-containing protein [Massilia sp. TS11]|uniref:putative bifunctional diguanylate cyclase/phosphodiesterase n=1 Tax=Massilia sp. TS11 TaxID=2908003 RepID=UPI001EDBF7D0|nr:EAL domain-containing protein [Massilia sp. TS11]